MLQQSLAIPFAADAAQLEVLVSQDRDVFVSTLIVPPLAEALGVQEDAITVTDLSVVSARVRVRRRRLRLWVQR